MPSFSVPLVLLSASACPAPAVEAFRLREVSWNRASSPGTNPPGVEVSSRRTAPRVAGWFGATRRGCSRDWWSDWPFSGAVGSHRTASPVNRRFWCWVLSDEVHSIRRSVDGEGLNAPSDAGCFLTRGFAPPRKREYQS